MRAKIRRKQTKTARELYEQHGPRPGGTAPSAWTALRQKLAELEER